MAAAATAQIMNSSGIVHPNAAAIEAEVATMIAAESERFSRDVFNLTVEGGSTNAAANAAAWHATEPKLQIKNHARIAVDLYSIDSAYIIYIYSGVYE